MSGKVVRHRYAYRSTSRGSVVVIVVRDSVKHGKIDYVVALVDLWKAGLKRCFGKFNAKARGLEKIFDGFEKTGTVIRPIAPKEARWIIKEGIRIREFLNLSIPSKCKKLLPIVGDLDSVKITGSIYKCFKCMKGELSPEIDQFIKKVALREIKEGIVGTPDEMRIYFLCDKCKGLTKS